jgi:hypothetical protein
MNILHDKGHSERDQFRRVFARTFWPTVQPASLFAAVHECVCVREWTQLKHWPPDLL